MITDCRWLAAALLALLGSTAAMADVTLTVKGAIRAAIPCTINNGSPVGVDFGTMKTRDVDGKNNPIAIDYKPDCKKAAGYGLRMQVRKVGGGAAFDSTVLGVPGNENLGVAVRRGSNNFPINTWFDFPANAPPELTAVLVKRAGSQVLAKPFSLGATLVMEYQ